MDHTRIKTEDALKYNRAYDDEMIQKCYLNALKELDKKIVVLDDDPTGIQTIHDIYVYTCWDKDTIREAFLDKNKMFFILTNSRSMTVEETEKLHTEIAENLVKVSGDLNIEFLLISRGDSTLRGHYPLETETIRNVMEKNGMKVDGEILVPFFQEGGRYTLNNVHYLRDDDELIPVGNTEFAKDWTFGYKNSDLKKWIQEKSEYRINSDNIYSITTEELFQMQTKNIIEKLIKLTNFDKMILNCTCYTELKIFTIALVQALKYGKNYIFRSAASITKILAGISDKALLTRRELTPGGQAGVIIVGSHVKKTTAQLEELMKMYPKLKYIEFDVRSVLNPPAFRQEQERVISELNLSLAVGRSAVVYTTREDFEINTGNKEDELRVSVKISNAVTELISTLAIQPGYIVAKGGITSSEIGTKGLEVSKALVLGQILPGIPVWRLGEECRFSGIPYVIFPGNVGSEKALAEIVGVLERKE